MTSTICFKKSELYFLVLMSLLWSCNHRYEQGKRIYDARCANCHMPNGEGLNLLIPALNRIKTYEADSVACLIKLGIASKDGVKPPMPPNEDLTEAELCNLVNYIYDEFAKKDAKYMLQDAKSLPCLRK